MNKKSIDGLIKTANLLEEKLQGIKNALEYIKRYNPKDHSVKERHEAEKSVEYAEDEIIYALTGIREVSLMMLNKIDPEAVREIRETE